MTKCAKVLITLAVSSLSLLAVGCGAGYGTGGVYVGVAVPGPYHGYPGYGGYMGPPPVIYYEEDALHWVVEPSERYARSPLREPEDRECEPGPKGSVDCAAASRPPAESADQAGDETDSANR